MTNWNEIKQNEICACANMCAWATQLWFTHIEFNTFRGTLPAHRSNKRNTKKTAAKSNEKRNNVNTMMMNQLAFFFASNKSTHVLPHIDNQMIDVYFTRNNKRARHFYLIQKNSKKYTQNSFWLENSSSGGKMHIFAVVVAAFGSHLCVCLVIFLLCYLICWCDFCRHYLYILHMCDFPVNWIFLAYQRYICASCCCCCCYYAHIVIIVWVSLAFGTNEAMQNSQTN